MIDLRSDTVTLPSSEMLDTISSAPLGDSGRWDMNRRGEDPSVNELEEYAAKLTGKAAAMFCVSGTMGNTAALLTYCRPGDTVLVDTHQHLYTKELGAFSSRLGQLKVAFYPEDLHGNPLASGIEQILQNQDIRLLCVEVSNNNRGGSIIPLSQLQEIYAVAKKKKTSVHMDGARIFNAAISMDVSAKQIAEFSDSCMFCVSKGIGAPIGSILCGSEDFIFQARETRRLLGGDMRQAGVLAAPALYALKHNISRLTDDNRRASLMSTSLQDLKNIHLPEHVDTNIVMLSVEEGKADLLNKLLRDHGILAGVVDNCRVRLVFHLGITQKETDDVCSILRQLDSQL